MTSLSVLLLPLYLVLQCQSASLPRHDVTSRDADDQIQQQRWLDDYDSAPRLNEDVLYDVMLADSPSVDTGDAVGRTGTDVTRVSQKVLPPPVDDEPDDDAPRCPPPILPVAMIGSWCSAGSRVDRCQTDTDCQSASPLSANRKRKCCNNGCRRVCAVPVDPAPYIDWKREPQTRLTSGKSWLIQGPAEPQEVEWCSTSYVYDDVTADEEPLLCPSGFTCYIDDPGDVDNGVPNRGRCVQESSGHTSDESANFRLATSDVTGTGSCFVQNVTYSNGASFGYKKHTCKCEDGSVMCRVGKKTTVASSKRRI